MSNALKLIAADRTREPFFPPPLKDEIEREKRAKKEFYKALCNDREDSITRALQKTEVCDLLLAKGAQSFTKLSGESPLHVLASKGASVGMHIFLTFSHTNSRKQVFFEKVKEFLPLPSCLTQIVLGYLEPLAFEAISGIELQDKRELTPFTAAVGGLYSKPRIECANLLLDYYIPNKKDLNYAIWFLSLHVKQLEQELLSFEANTLFQRFFKNFNCFPHPRIEECEASIMQLCSLITKINDMRK